MVDFCSKCGAIVMGKKGEEVKCAACGHINRPKHIVSLKEKIDKKEEKEILDSGAGVEVHPTTKVECPKCANDEAYYFSKQMRAGDEPETQFFKCTKCKHQWRSYM